MKKMNAQEMKTTNGGIFLWTAFCRDCGLGMNAYCCNAHKAYCPYGNTHGFKYRFAWW